MLNTKIGFNSTKQIAKKLENKSNSKNIGFGADVPTWREIAGNTGRAIQSRLPLNSQGVKKAEESLKHEIANLSPTSLNSDPDGQKIARQAFNLPEDRIVTSVKFIEPGIYVVKSKKKN